MPVSSELSDRVAATLRLIDQYSALPSTVSETRELLADIRDLVVDVDHARRHYKHTTEMAARKWVKREH